MCWRSTGAPQHVTYYVLPTFSSDVADEILLGPDLKNCSRMNSICWFRERCSRFARFDNRPFKSFRILSSKAVLRSLMEYSEFELRLGLDIVMISF
jgi:hypothetical protein